MSYMLRPSIAWDLALCTAPKHEANSRHHARTGNSPARANHATDYFRHSLQFPTEPLRFEVMGVPGAYNTILRRPCYVQFMVIASYTYLRLKIPGPHEIITVATSSEEAYVWEQANCKLVSVLAASRELAELQIDAM